MSCYTLSQKAGIAGIELHSQVSRLAAVSPQEEPPFVNYPDQLVNKLAQLLARSWHDSLGRSEACEGHMAEKTKDQSVQTFTRKEYDADPVRVVKATREGPVEVVDDSGKRTMYLTRPGCEPAGEYAAAE